MDKKPSETEVLEAVRKLILWAGDDPEREGLVETPKRVAKAYKEFFSGYHDDPYEILNKTFEEITLKSKPASSSIILLLSEPEARIMGSDGLILDCSILFEFI